MYLIYGRILDSKGIAIPNAKLIDVPSWATSDDYGIFQAEIFSDTTILRFETERQICTVMLPPYTENEGIVAIGDLLCDLQAKVEQ